MDWRQYTSLAHSRLLLTLLAGLLLRLPVCVLFVYFNELLVVALQQQQPQQKGTPGRYKSYQTAKASPTCSSPNSFRIAGTAGCFTAVEVAGEYGTSSMVQIQ